MHSAFQSHQTTPTTYQQALQTYQQPPQTYQAIPQPTNLPDYGFDPTRHPETMLVQERQAELAAIR